MQATDNMGLKFFDISPGDDIDVTYDMSVLTYMADMKL